eukprot:SAG11_NODE_11396_length_763_cov_1.549699_2_plen_174_part_01
MCLFPHASGEGEAPTTVPALVGDRIGQGGDGSQSAAGEELHSTVGRRQRLRATPTDGRSQRFSRAGLQPRPESRFFQSPARSVRPAVAWLGRNSDWLSTAATVLVLPSRSQSGRLGLHQQSSSQSWVDCARGWASNWTTWVGLQCAPPPPNTRILLRRQPWPRHRRLSVPLWRS